MKTANIALFKEFLVGEGLDKMFVGMYKQCPFPENPANIEEYFKNVDVSEVVMNAFRFPEGLEKFGLDFWFDVAIKWEKKLREATADGSQYATYNQAKIERKAAKPLSMWQTPQKSNAVQKKEPTEQKPRVVQTDEEAVVSDFKFFSINESSHRKLLDGRISITANQSGHRLTFNRTVSEEIVNANLLKFQIGQKGEDKHLYMVFSNNADGINWRSNSGNVVIANKPLVVKICKFFGLKEGYEQLAISKNQANVKSLLVYKISLI